MKSKDAICIAGFLSFLAFAIPVTITAYREKWETEGRYGKSKEVSPLPLPDYHTIVSRLDDETNIENLEYDCFVLSWDKKRNSPALCSFWINRDSRSDVYFYWSPTNDPRCVNATWEANKFPYRLDATNETVVPLAPKSFFWQSKDAELATLAIPMQKDMWVEWNEICKSLFQHLTQYGENFAVTVGPIFSKKAERLKGRPVATSFFIAVYSEREVYSIKEKSEKQSHASVAIILTRNKETNLPEFKYASLFEVEKRAHVTLFSGLVSDSEKGQMQKDAFFLLGNKPLTTFEFAEWQREEEKRKAMEARNMRYIPPVSKKEHLTGSLSSYSESEIEWRRKNGLPCSVIQIEVKNFKGAFKETQ